MSFVAYIKTCKAGDDPAGDFVREARDDRELPDVLTWKQLELYLSKRGVRSSGDCGRQAGLGGVRGLPRQGRRIHLGGAEASVSSLFCTLPRRLLRSIHPAVSPGGELGSARLPFFGR